MLFRSSTKEKRSATAPTKYLPWDATYAANNPKIIEIEVTVFGFIRVSTRALVNMRDIFRKTKVEKKPSSFRAAARNRRVFSAISRGSIPITGTLMPSPNLLNENVVKNGATEKGPQPCYAPLSRVVEKK